MPGHLFIVQGDLTQVACDAWLLPTSRTLWVEEHWLDGLPVLKANGKRRLTRPGKRPRRAVYTFRHTVERPEDWDTGETRTVRVNPSWLPREYPSVWLTRMAVEDWRTAREKSRWFADGARQFVENASAALIAQSAAPPNDDYRLRRLKPLLALPVVGTGEGGGSEEAGSVLHELIRVLSETISDIDADVVLVAYRREQFAAAQHARREYLRKVGSDHWIGLPNRLRSVARSLATHSARNDLVLFLGAGVSVGAGLPDWGTLLGRLADEVGLSEAVRQDLANLPHVDQARYIQNRLEHPPDGAAPRSFTEATSAIVKSDRYGLTHALLANLNCRECVTTNYDTLFEAASADAGRESAVLPYESAVGAQRWLLKLHGCVKHAEDIVLTREDYLRYRDQRGALAGIVQALLITRHMLFIGFSLTDENFHHIIDDVRKVARLPVAVDGTARPARFGTALLLDPSPLVADLWREDIACVSIADERLVTPVPEPAGGDDRLLSAAHRLEVMLDFMLYHANQNVSHVLDRRYDGLLSEPEQALNRLVLNLAREANDEMRGLPAWRPVARMLEELGGGVPSDSPLASERSTPSA